QVAVEGLAQKSEGRGGAQGIGACAQDQRAAPGQSQEVSQQARLADPRVTVDDDGPAAATGGVLEFLLEQAELGGAAHETWSLDGRLHGTTAAGAGGGGRRGSIPARKASFVRTWTTRPAPRTPQRAPSQMSTVFSSTPTRSAPAG